MQARNALSRQELAALVEQRLRPGGGVARARFERAQALEEGEHARAIALEGFAGGVNLRLQGRHQRTG